ncbi:hypothetical protein T439DRAFT_379009 [Meredithblackwellia eburnea MCA 4105]
MTPELAEHEQQPLETEGQLSLQQQQQSQIDNQDKLDGQQVLQLTLFLDKKVWIDDKIKLLSTLPPIEAIEPQPPTPSPTTKDQFKLWWEEHDRIERDIYQYDIGDLAKLRTFAKHAAQKELSPADTDLVEVTLVTLVSVDQLLSLLRKRRKELDLLRYRLQWEAAILNYSTEHRKLQEYLTRFLSKARWSLPTTSTAESTSTFSHSQSASSPSASPYSKSLTFHSSASTSSLTSLYSLSSITTTGGTTTHSTTSATSRAMRPDVLALELSSLKPKVHSVTATLIPETGRRLDKLIDSSLNPLPDSFLDHQDSIEEDARKLTDGLVAFLGDVARQWKNAEEVFLLLRDTERVADTLQRDVEDALMVEPRLPALELVGGFEERLKTAQRDLGEARRGLGPRREGKEGFLPVPTHCSFPEQEGENDLVVETLRDLLLDAEHGVKGAEEVVAKFRVAAETLERAKTVTSEIGEAARELRRFVEETRGMGGRPDMDNPERCLALPIEEGERTFNDTFARLKSVVQPTAAKVPKLLQKASSVVVELNSVGIDTNVRNALKESMGELSLLLDETNGVLREDEERRRCLEAARKWQEGILAANLELESVRKEALEELENAKWQVCSSHSVESPFDLHSRILALRDDLHRLLDSSSAEAAFLLSKTHVKLYTDLESRTKSLWNECGELDHLATLLRNIRAQRVATDTLLAEVTDIAGAVEAVGEETREAILVRKQDSWVEGELETKAKELRDRLQVLARSLDEVARTSHVRIPFVSHSSSPSFAPRIPDLPFDLSNLDSRVKNAVNSALAAAQGRADEVKLDISTLDHLREAFEWDRSHEEASLKVTEVHDAVFRLRMEFDSRDGNIADQLVELRTRGSVLVAALETLNDTITSLRTGIDSLRAHPSSVNPIFASHHSRELSLSSTLDRHATALANVTAFLDSVDGANLERQRKETADAALIARGKDALSEIESLHDKISMLVNEVKGLPGRPRLDDLACLVPTTEEDSFREVHRQLLDQMSRLAEKVPSLCEESQAILAKLQASGLVLDMVENLMAATATLRASVTSLDDAKSSFATESKALVDARALSTAFRDAGVIAQDTKKSLSASLEGMRWTAESTPKSFDPISTTSIARERIDTCLAAVIANIPSFTPSYPILYQHFNSKASELLYQVHEFNWLGALTSTTSHHTSSARKVLDDISHLDSEITSALQEMENLLDQSSTTWTYDESKAVAASLSNRLLNFQSQAQELITSIAPRFSEPSSPTFPLPNSLLPPSLSYLPPRPPELSPSSTFSLQEQHCLASETINSQQAILGSHLESLDHVLKEIDHLSRAKTWDFRHEQIQAEVHQCHEAALQLHQQFVSRPTSDAEFFKAHRDSTIALRTALQSCSTPLAASKTLLDDLKQSPLAQHSRHNSHVERNSLLEKTVALHASALEQSTSLLSSIDDEEDRAMAKKLEEADSKLQASFSSKVDNEALENPAISNVIERQQLEQRLALEKSWSVAADQLENSLEALRSRLMEQASIADKASLLGADNSSTFATLVDLQAALDSLEPVDPNLVDILHRLGKMSEALKHLTIDIESCSTEPFPEMVELAEEARLLLQRTTSLQTTVAVVRSALEDRIRLHDISSTPNKSPLPKHLDLPGLSSPSINNGRTTFTSALDVEDVFGPTLQSVPFPSESQEEQDPGSQPEFDHIKELLHSIETDLWLDEEMILHLPTRSDSEHIQNELSSVSDQIKAISSDSTIDTDALRRVVNGKLRSSGRIKQLADFNEHLEAAHAALSDLLSSIDATTPVLDLLSSDSASELGPSPPPTLPLGNALLEATRAVTTARREAITLIDDSRVESQLHRLEETYAEMEAMVDDLNSKSRPSSSASSSQSSAHSSVSSHQIKSLRPASRATASTPGSLSQSSSSRPTSRLAAGTPTTNNRRPSPVFLEDTLGTPRKYSIGRSSGQPTSGIPRATPRARVVSMASMSTTIPRAFSFATSTPRASLSKSTSGIESGRKSATLSRSIGKWDNNNGSIRKDVPRSVRSDSVTSSSSSMSRSSLRVASTPTPREKRSVSSIERRKSNYPVYPSPPTRKSPPRAKVAYKPNLKRKVDVEVGRIVNELPIYVPIKAVDDDSKIDSGMYWIGDTNPRLYFVRILRSKMAMVRVGGGWQELTQFLTTHFADTASIANLTISPTLSKRTLDQSWISSNSLRQSLGASTRSSSTLSQSTSSLSLSVRSTGYSPLRRASGADALSGSLSRSTGLGLGFPPNLPVSGEAVTPKPTKIWRP